MKRNGSKWPLALAALLMLAATWLDGGFGAFENISAADLVPVLVITALVFLLKTGILSAILLGLKKLWDHLRRGSK